MSAAVRDFAKRPDKERGELFRETSRAMQVREAIIEKDFWVCWVLDYLFQDSPWRDKLFFKGGTSLSKGYAVIQRFSEDVDLILDWTLLGFTEQVAFQDRTNKKQDEFCDKASQQTVQFLEANLVPTLRNDLSNRLGRSIELSLDEQIVLLAYPCSFKDGSIRSEIALEIGPKALQVPNELRDIRPYVAEQHPTFFTSPNTSVRTVSAERTLWEKATILHQEAHRSPDKKLPLRYSRHYYDLFQLSRTPIFKAALGQIGLLEDVAKFKMKFFRSGWANYEAAKPGSLRLRPPKHNEVKLRQDYVDMQSMLFGPAPTFDEILDGLEAIEKEINGRVEIHQ